MTNECPYYAKNCNGICQLKIAVPYTFCNLFKAYEQVIKPLTHKDFKGKDESELTDLVIEHLGIGGTTEVRR